MNRPPAFQFYPKDWLDFKVQRMSFAAQGVYMKLLCYMWNDSRTQYSILNDDNLLAQAIGLKIEDFLQIKLEIQNKKNPVLVEKNGYLISERLKHEALKQRKYRKLQAEKGLKSAQQRFNRGSTVVQPEGQPKVNSSSLSSSSSSVSNTKKQKKRVLLPPTPLKGESNNNLKDSYFSFNPEDFQNLWNLTLGNNNFSKCQGLDVKENNRKESKTRRQLIEALLKQKQCPGYWQYLFSKVATSPFLRGENDKKWKANIDFVIRPGNHIKIMEGKYDDREGWTKENWDLWFGK